MRILVRKIHKWVFIFTGIFMFLWVLTGVMLSWPVDQEWEPLVVSDHHSNRSFLPVSLSPSEAADILSPRLGGRGNIKDIRLKKVYGKPMYEILDNKDNKYLLDAATRKLFVLTLDDAARLVKRKYRLESGLVHGEIIRQYSLAYSWGELPAYKLQFSGEPDIYVRPIEATVLRNTALVQAQVISGLLHPFEPLRLLPGGESIRKTAMILAGLISLLGTIAGIYLTLPVRKRRN